MSICENAAVVGLGLIGGSVARDLHALGVRVSAFDADAGRLAGALHDGIVAEALDASMAGIETADVVVLAVPVDVAADVLSCVAARARRAALITDVGSTKARIVGAAAALGVADRFVGSHPMAGDHRSGWDASRAGLFTGARVYLCPTDAVAPASLELASSFWQMLGARPMVIGAEEHDRKLAWASHLPHVLAASLALAMAGAGVQRHDLGPGGRDMTRLAGGSPGLWTAIARENAAALDAALADAEREIAAFRLAIARREDDGLRRRFAEAKGWFDE